MVTILIADDRPSSRESLASLLRNEGHRVLLASDGDEALRLARLEQPDLVISDILTPVVGGYEFVKRLRDDPVTERIPVVFSAADYLQPEARTLADACGVTHVIVKPGQPPDFINVVERALGAPSQRLDDRSPQAAAPAVQRPLAAAIELGARLCRERDPSRLVETFTQSAHKIIGAESAAVGILSEDGQTLAQFYATPIEGGASRETAQQEAALRRLVQEHLTVGLAGAPETLESRGLLPGVGPMLSVRAAGIGSPNRSCGWLCFINKTGADQFDDEDEMVAVALGAQLGAAYETASLRQQMLRRVSELENELSELRKAEEEIRQTARKYRILMEQASDGILISDREGRYTEVNRQACQMLGYEREELLEMSAADLAPSEAAPANPLHLDMKEHEAVRVEGRLSRKDGKLIDVDISLSPLEDGRVQAIVRDITTHRQLEDQLRHAQKMEAVGRLAGGIAHDFNNLLTAIIGYSQFALGQLERHRPVQRELEEIRNAGVRAAELTSQLLAFSRKQVQQPRALELNSVVKSTERMLKRLIGEDVELVTILDPEQGTIQADPGHIEQVIMNLAVNARDAMSKGGKLTIETVNVDLDQDYARQHVGVQPGPHVMLAITDTGCGMDKRVQAQIFEPFFTTKEQGKGTGLGLSTVYGIIRQSGGNVWVYSEPGHGTVFKVYFPRVDKPADACPPELLAPLPRGTETVLLVEDEVLVRELAAIVLRELGYKVLAASSGEEALMLSRQQSQEKIDLLLTDVVMPRMSGKSLAQKLASVRPDVKVLFVSGYTDDAIVEHGVLGAEESFLQKPFTPGSLARRVREVLGQTATARK